MCQTLYNECMGTHYCVYTIDGHSEWIHALKKVIVLAVPAISNICAVSPAFQHALGATGQMPKCPVAKDLQAILWVCGLAKNKEGPLDDRPLEASSITPQQHRVTGQLGSSLK